MNITDLDIKIPADDAEALSLVGSAADAMGRECYVVGGYVRDLFLKRHSKDIDFVTVGSGIEIAKEVHRRLGAGTHLAVFRNFGTAQVKSRNLELEFVGARKESYHRDSRKPIVEDGTLDDDLCRRDFTVNALAICLNKDRYGELVDMFDGMGDMERGTIRTPLDPDITFSDDPLRMMRAIRFATQLGFDIYPSTLKAIERNAARLEIISAERIKDEVNKVMLSPRPSVGWKLLSQTGLLKYFLPELEALRGVEVKEKRGHKDNFFHTLQVLDNVSRNSNDLWLRWAALLHDIAKPLTKHYDHERGWTFHNHNIVGANMVTGIFRRLRLPLGGERRFVKKIVELHMRPISLVEDEVTDSAVRRLRNYAGDDLPALMILARADITSKNLEKKQRFLDNFDLVERKFEYIKQKDAELAYRNPIDGNEIMEIFGLTPSPMVGTLVQSLKQAIKDCEIEDTRAASLDFLLAKGREMGLTVVKEPSYEEPEKEISEESDLSEKSDREQTAGKTGADEAKKTKNKR